MAATNLEQNKQQGRTFDGHAAVAVSAVREKDVTDDKMASSTIVNANHSRNSFSSAAVEFVQPKCSMMPGTVTTASPSSALRT
jgi:hypothetical protein